MLDITLLCGSLIKPSFNYIYIHYQSPLPNLAPAGGGLQFLICVVASPLFMEGGITIVSLVHVRTEKGDGEAAGKGDRIWRVPLLLNPSPPAASRVPVMPSCPVTSFPPPPTSPADLPTPVSSGIADYMSEKTPAFLPMSLASHF